jgi:hypothetical protein
MSNTTNALLAHVAKNGFTLDEGTYKAVVSELAYESAKTGVASLNFRFKNWLGRHGIVPGTTDAAHISPELVAEWLDAAKANPDYATIVNALIANAPEALRTKVQAISAEEAEAKRNPDTLIAYAKENGITLKAVEVSAAFGALSEPSRMRLIVAIGSVTGRHGNRQEYPQGDVTLSAPQFTALQASLGDVAISRLARGVAGLYNEETKGAAEQRLVDERTRAAARNEIFGGQAR